jgi:excisionase family DNA binding protein
MQQEWYTPEQVAERLQVSIWTVRRWLREGILGGVRFEGQWRISSDDVARFVDEQRKKAVA